MKKGSSNAVESAKHCREIKIVNKFGIHARPAALFVKTASRFKADILVEKDGMSVNGKSIMGLLTIQGQNGAVVKVTAEGPDAAGALKALQELIEQKFHED